MAKSSNILLAGFGGQGILFAGKLLAYAGLIEEDQVTWLPSYGPEMRGGTANCSVCLSDMPIGSPLVLEPDILVALNQPSLDMFFDKVAPGGKVFVDSMLVPDVPKRDDVTVFSLPATETCDEAGLKGLANVLLVGKVLKETACVSVEALDAAIVKSIPPKRIHLLEPNRKAFDIGYNS